MPRIRCFYLGCGFLDDGYCSAASVEIDPDEGCLTFTSTPEIADDDWIDETEIDDWEDFEADDDLWLDDN